MTGGRYIAGFAPGAFPTDAQLFGTGDNNPEMMREAIDIIEAIWTRDAPFRIEGKYWTVDMPPYAEIWHGPHMKPLQSPRPDVIISGTQPESPSLIAAGRHGFSPVSQQVSAPVLRQHWETYSTAATEAGHEPDRARWRVLRDIFVADTDEEARRLVIEGAPGKTYDRVILPIFKKFGLADLMLAPGMEPDDLTVEWMADNCWLVGSPETVAEKVTALDEEAGGIGVLLTGVFEFQDDPEPFRRSLELLGREVAPRVADVGARAATRA
jgi:alkanesulfonate monooxygenase SsuD/methylene tetrahydromethanopterin reductase-like flavin-dependent oxidoreductase (luciferase family)